MLSFSCNGKIACQNCKLVTFWNSSEWSFRVVILKLTTILHSEAVIDTSLDAIRMEWLVPGKGILGF
jgi:hypothetical protein